MFDRQWEILTTSFFLIPCKKPIAQPYQTSIPYDNNKKIEN